MTMSETTKRKADLLAAGLYPTSKGFVVKLAEMNDHHLINALLKALRAAEPEAVTYPLAREVKRRGLSGEAFSIVESKEGSDG